MRITSWLKDWLVTPGIDDSWVARAEEEMQREAEEWAARKRQRYAGKEDRTSCA